MARPKGIPHTEEWKKKVSEINTGKAKNETGRILSRKEIYERYRTRHPEKIIEAREKHKPKRIPVDAAYRKTDAYKQSQKAYRASETYLNAQLQWKYGISVSDYYRMLDEQKGLCAACGEPLILNGLKRPAIDHNHITKKVRGVIHSWCNLTIGQAKENPNLLRKLAEYLERVNA